MYTDEEVFRILWGFIFLRQANELSNPISLHQSLNTPQIMLIRKNEFIFVFLNKYPIKLIRSKK